MHKQWQITERLDDDLWQHLLKSRGLVAPDQQEHFFNPDLSQLVSAWDWPDMDQAVARIQQAITNKEPMVVWGDFDADGVTATAIMWETLHSLGAEALPYIPNRDTEGHGFSDDGLQKLAADGTKLLITVDHGVTAFDDIKRAVELGMEVIVTDHHMPAAKDQVPNAKGKEDGNDELVEYIWPECVAIIHPFRLSNPEKLAGCGAAYFLSYAVWLKVGGKTDDLASRQEFADTYIELVALGTVADMMPLTGMNRVLASIGLQKLAGTRRVGLQELYKVADLQPKERLSIYEVGFVVAPRLNAPGRLAQALDSLRLVCTKDVTRAAQLARELDGLNSQRQTMLAKVIEQATKVIESRTESNAYVLVNKDWPAGVCGLAAGRLVEKVYRPVVVMQDMGEMSRGSARSIKGFDITSALTSISDLLDGYGGHAMAAGFTCKTEVIPEIEKRLSDLVSQQLSAEQLQPTLVIDAEVGLEEMNEDLMAKFLSLEPCGMGNPKPIFVARNMEVASVKTMGKEGSHLKLGLASCGLDVVAFGFGKRAPQVGDTVEAVFSLEANEWNGRRSLQLNVKDMHIAMEKS